MVGIPRAEAVRLPLPLPLMALTLLPEDVLPVPHQELLPVGQAPPQALGYVVARGCAWMHEAARVLPRVRRIPRPRLRVSRTPLCPGYLTYW